MDGCWFRWSRVVLSAATALPLWGCTRNLNNYDGGNAAEVGPSVDGASPREVFEAAPSISAGLDLGAAVDRDATSDAAKPESLDGRGIDGAAEPDAPLVVEVRPDSRSSPGEVRALDIGSEGTGGAAGSGGTGGSTDGTSGGGGKTGQGGNSETGETGSGGTRGVGGVVTSAAGGGLGGRGGDGVGGSIGKGGAGADVDAAEPESLDGGGIDCAAEPDAPAVLEVWPETVGSPGDVSALDVGSESTGGATGSGGAGGSTGGAGGGGCTGIFETIQSDTGLCVAKMVTIAGPPSDSGNADYSIDVTEVTTGQYHAWLATNPALPPSTDPQCGYVTSYAETGIAYAGTDPDHGPVGSVDWCDAYMYCKAVGKRMCGAIGGGTLEYGNGDTADANKSQWYRACTNGGVYAYPYGNTYRYYCYDTSYHNPACVVSGPPAPLSNCGSATVGSQSNCVTVELGYAGVYDLTGNVWEWEDAHYSLGYHIRGGAANSAQRDVSCNSGAPLSIDSKWAGIRCCSK